MKLFSDDTHYGFRFDSSARPLCLVCGVPMVHSVDEITKKVSEYSWQTTCGHNSKLRLHVG